MSNDWVEVSTAACPRWRAASARARAHALLFVALIIWRPATLRADPAPAAAPAVPADVRALADAKIRAGVELRRQGREREALDRFREAYALDSSARALGQMGLAAKSIRLHVEAERYLRAALVVADDPWVQKNREALELALAIVAKQLASLLVVSNVEGAELFVNGTRVGELPLADPVRVTAGAARVALRARGYSSSESQVTLPAGETIEVRLDLVPAPKPPVARARPSQLPASRRAAIIAADAPQTRLPWIITAASVGAVGLGLGAYFGLETLSQKADRDRLCGGADSVDCPSSEGLEHDRAARTAATWSTVSFAVGAVAVGAAVVLVLLEPGSKPAGSARAALVPAATQRVASGWHF